MFKLSRFTTVVIFIAFLAFPVLAKSRHEMCEIAEMAIQTISQKSGDSTEITAQKRSTVHNLCFTAPLAEIEETYSYLIENWDTVFDQASSR